MHNINFKNAITSNLTILDKPVRNFNCIFLLIEEIYCIPLEFHNKNPALL